MSAVKDNLLSITDFAAKIGVSYISVTKAINAGRLTVIRRGKRKFLDAEKGPIEWERSRSSSGGKPMAVKTEKPPAPANPGDENDSASMSIYEVERKDKFYKAEMSKLKYQEQIGELVQASHVKKEAFTAARKIRDAVMSVPSRLAPELASETDPHRIELLLTKELSEMLEKTSGATT